MLKLLINRFVNKYKKYKFNNVISKIEQTLKVENISNEHFEFIVVSQIYSKALWMTLLAIKSFVQTVEVNVRIDLIDDGSLTVHDKEKILIHLPNCNIVNIKDIDVFTCPNGGTWERLHYILALSKDHYVVQVDTDTVTIGDVREVLECVKDNRAFIISGPKWGKPIKSNEMASLARSWNNPHIQSVSEGFFDQLDSIKMEFYCRGCSAFTGFPKGVDLQSHLIAFSKELESFVGKERWKEWGTEQLSSNVMISLTSNPLILPWPKYQNHGFPFVKHDSNVSLYHFIGTHRFDNGLYNNLANQFIKDNRRR